MALNILLLSAEVNIDSKNE